MRQWRFAPACVWTYVSRGQKPGVKKPQVAQQQTDVAASAAQHDMDRFAARAFEPVSPQFAIGLHVTDGRLNGAIPPAHK